MAVEIKSHFKAGGCFVDLPPIFSLHSDCVYIAWKNQILGYNTKTGTQFGVFKGLKNRIVGFGVHLFDGNECITACSVNGDVITWKITTHFKIFNKKLDTEKVKSFHIVPGKDLKALIACAQDHIVCRLYNLEDGSHEEYSIHLQTSARLYIDCTAHYFAVAQKSVLHVVRLDEFSTAYTFTIETSRQFTAIKCNSFEESLLTGDQTGRALLWRGIFTPKPAKTVYHWHTLPVRCLTFSASGNYFYSGGDEAVLVQWQNENHHQKKFLPRLPGSLQQIAVSGDNTLIAVATSDNAVKIIDSRFETVSLIQNFVIGTSLGCGIVYEGRTKTLVMNGNVGQIQFYSPSDNSLMYKVDVVGQNKISNERTCNIINTEISKLALTKDGTWMATLELREDLDFSLEQRLKFWFFDSTLQNYKLNTLVEDPHGAEVTAVKFQPVSNSSELKCVSVGDDKKFKIWGLTRVESDEKGAKSVWDCLSMGYYHDLSCKGLAFSIDGSLLAVGFGSNLTLWTPDSCAVKATFSHPVSKKDVTQIEFGAGNQCHLVVAASSDRLSVWNILTLTMLWTVPLSSTVLISDEVTTNMAVFTKDQKVYVFAPKDPEPIYESSTVLRGQTVETAVFVPTKYGFDAGMSWHQRAPIYFVNSKKQLYYIGQDEEEIDAPSQYDSLEPSAFNFLVPEKQSGGKGPEPIKHLFHEDGGKKSITKYLEAPIQTMIPIRIMCGSLLKAMVLQKST